MTRPLTAVRFALAAAVTLAGIGCRPSSPPDDCVPTPGTEIWVERRQPPAAGTSDTAYASLSIAMARDSVDRLPAGTMISLVIAGPSSATPPDTVRLLTAEDPTGLPLWRGDALRPGQYTAELTTSGFAAGPRTFTLAPGERAEVEVRVHRTSGCANDTAQAAR
jgi:hypothetical protein